MKQTNSGIYCSCSTSLKINSLIENIENKLPRWSPLSKIKNPELVRKMVSGNNPRCLIWKGTNTLEFHDSNDKPRSFTLENEAIKDIQSGYLTFLILTKSGNMYSFASSRDNTYHEIPLENSQSSTFDNVRPVPFFNDEKNNRKVEQFAMVGWSNYYLCKNGDLYGNGYNSGRLGDGTSSPDRSTPVLIFQNVTRVFGGVRGYCFFFTTKSNELYSCGANQQGSLGTGSSNSEKSPVKVSNWKAEDILYLQTHDSFSILISKEGKTYSTGNGSYNGIGRNVSSFTVIEELKNKKVVQYCGGSRIALFLTDENELYGWGFNDGQNPTDQNNYIGNKATRINLPEYYQNNPSIKFKITCGTVCVYLYPRHDLCLIQDFKKLFESKEFCDHNLNLNQSFEIPIHKIIIESRIHLKIKEIENLLKKESFSKEEILLFLRWVYLGEIEDVNLVKRFFDSLNLTYPPKNTFLEDLCILYNDEDSKDFSLLIKNDDEDEDEDEDDDDDEEEEDEFEELPVHKIILLARSGLFREMFNNLNEKEKNINQIKDYSRKSIDSIEILMKYLYTGKIELTADHDPELTIEELQDAAEYYQLNQNSDIIGQLNQIKSNL
ncbi:hypothetical protein M0813_16720 [Anaeramoeba flamelloides]|uniref:BTB domain-containing protein n=1 Tax=Anaeramoeba flamelloides TaxID=1746091 RepID=A0ABQ8Z037_9EUKA|nr:hypothetical protein M0813_16720 [Anaeramoeba flamelloides]